MHLNAWCVCIDSSSINQIVDIVDGDIRSALNTLQFMQRKFGSVAVGSESVALAAVGHKDVGKVRAPYCGLFALFAHPTPCQRPVLMLHAMACTAHLLAEQFRAVASDLWGDCPCQEQTEELG